MTPSTRRILALYGAILFASVAQALWADAITVRGARPDLITATAVLCALQCGANEAAFLGFLAGLMMAALTSPPKSGFGSLIVSRTVVGFAVGWLEERIERDNPILAVLLVTAGTALAHCFFFLFDPQRSILHWARSMGLGTLYNTIIALPLYLLLRLMIGKRTRECLVHFSCYPRARATMQTRSAPA